MADLAECRELLGRAETERSRRLLQTELAVLEDEHRVALSAKDAYGLPAAGDHRLASYAWDQSGKFVRLYITVENVHNLPAGNITCSFEPLALDLRVRGSDGKEKYLLLRPLCDEIDVAGSSYAVKTDRINLKLCKKTPGSEWGSIDDSGKKEKEIKEEKARTNQGKSTGQLLSEMYGQADDDAKKKLEEAWERGREKREGMRANP
mmetsp:Transcript_9126/g.23168  ORF Transcript_9126/g.23168 Transcript_9126/m.23168 type:complete len:206 (-) Transcript_9126:246-863(-)